MTASTPTTPEGYLSGAAYPPTFQVVRHVIDFLKWRFSLLPAGAYRWDPESDGSPEQSGSEIFISADTPIMPEKVGQRPAITVLRSTAAFQGVGIGDVAFNDLATGAVVRMDIIPTTVMVNVLSRLPVEAEKLGWFVLEQIWAFRDAIIRSEPSILYTGNRPSLSPPSPAGSLVAPSTDVEWSVVVVSFPTFLQHATTTLPLNKRIVKGFTTTMTTVDPSAGAQPKPVSLLQGTAVMQPIQPESDRNAATTDSAALPQTGQDEASSTEPLTVTIKT